MSLQQKLMVLCCLFFTQDKAVIVEHDSIMSINNYVEDQTKTLIIFDMDNTLVETEIELGSDQWFSYKIEEGLKNGKLYQDVLQELLPLYRKIRQRIPFKFIETEIPGFLDSLRNKGHHLMVLTAVGPEQADQVHREFKRLGISFTSLLKHSSPSALSNLNQHFQSFPSAPGFSDGILFVGSNNKGTVLMLFLEIINYMPSHIIFIDDKEKNLKDVQQAVEARGISFTGIRYSRLDEKVRAFDPQISERQLQKLHL